MARRAYLSLKDRMWKSKYFLREGCVEGLGSSLFFALCWWAWEIEGGGCEDS